MENESVVTDGCTSERESLDVESSTDRYAERFAGPAGVYLLGVQTGILLDLLKPWPGARVLDVGGGHAQAALPLMAAGYDVTVLGSCEAALERLRRAAPDVNTVIGDLCDPPLNDRSFDIAVALRMMPHVRDWRHLLTGLCRVARRAVVVDFPTPVSANVLVPLLFGAKKQLEGDTRRFKMMRRREVRQAFTENGFRDLAERPQFFWPIVLHRGLKRPGLSRGFESAARRVHLTRLLGSPVVVRAVREDCAGA